MPPYFRLFPLLLLAFLAYAGAVPVRAQGNAPGVSTSKPARKVAVLLWDGKIPEQVKLEEEARAGLKAYEDRLELRSMHAGRAETVPFLRKHNLTRANAPVLLILDEPGPRARIVNRVPLDAREDPRQNVRSMLAALKLPLPRVEPPKPGPIAAFAADGGAEEKKYLLEAGGGHRIENGSRVLDPTSWVAYRLPVPEALRKADLRAEVAGAFLIEWAETSRGPWEALVDSGTFFGGGEERIREPLKPVVDLTPTLENLPGSLFIRVRPNGRGRAGATLSRLEFVALGPGEPSREASWGEQIEMLRKKYGLALPSEVAAGSVIGGALEKDRVLTAAGSPYTLAGDLVVPWGKKLTVEPGVTVRATGRFSIRVMGDLIALGTADQPITFTALKPEQPGDWRGIEFVPQRGYSSGAKSVLEFCRVTNASSVELKRFDGEISSSVFENNTLGLLLKDGGKGRIRHNRFVRCHKGLVIDGGAGEVTDNEWTECLVALSVAELHATLPFKFERNSLVGSLQAAVQYFKQPNRKVKTLALPNNHWGGTAPERLISGGAGPEDVLLEPRLPEPPAGVGPQARL